MEAIADKLFLIAIIPYVPAVIGGIIGVKRTLDGWDFWPSFKWFYIFAFIGFAMGGVACLLKYGIH